MIIVLIPPLPHFEEERERHSEQRPPWLFKHTVKSELSFECIPGDARLMQSL